MSRPGPAASVGFGMWPYGETVTADAHGRFRVDGLQAGRRDRVIVESTNRPGVLLDGGNALRKPVLKPGEVRDLGDVKVKVVRRQ